MDRRYRERQALISSLEKADTSASQTQADRLRELYKAREFAGLSRDSYDAAQGIGRPDTGWARGSENYELLRKQMPGLDISEEELQQILKPEGSSFRAEIYLPDEEVLGPGFKPTLIFKGSGGQVVGLDGETRDSTIEDFLGNNFPQAIGIRTDYYDRGMQIASRLQLAGMEFEMGGHSLGAAVSSAAAQVTGMRAITFNAAGLHPETTARFARENGKLPVYDNGANITAWQVQGDLLNDGVQGDLDLPPLAVPVITDKARG